MPYLDDYWSDPFGWKYDPLVFEVFQLLKYFGNFTTFFSHSISKDSKTSVISYGNTNLDIISFLSQFLIGLYGWIDTEADYIQINEFSCLNILSSRQVWCDIISNTNQCWADPSVGIHYRPVSCWLVSKCQLHMTSFISDACLGSTKCIVMLYKFLCMSDL